MSLFYITLEKKPKGREIFNLAKVLQINIRVEVSHPKSDIFQCHRCQRLLVPKPGTKRPGVPNATFPIQANYKSCKMYPKRRTNTNRPRFLSPSPSLKLNKIKSVLKNQEYRKTM